MIYFRNVEKGCILHDADTDFVIHHVSGTDVRVQIHKIWKDREHDNRNGYDILVYINGRFIKRFEHGSWYDWELSHFLEAIVDIAVHYHNLTKD